jgi:hypothetical protein
VTRQTASQRLLARLREMGLAIPRDALIRSARPSKGQRAAGQWRWWIETVDPDGDTHQLATPIGSHHTVVACLEAPRLEISNVNGEWTIDVADALPIIPPGATLSNRPSFTKYQDGWVLSGPESELIPGETIEVERYSDDPSIVTVGDHLAARTVRKLNGPPVRYVFATIIRPRKEPMT